MAGVLIVTCPACEKKFKPKSDVSGKKIKCPFCSEAFVVPAAKEDKAKPDAAKAGKSKEEPEAKAEEAKAAPVVTSAPPDDDDQGVDPYGVKHVELVPRCPNCTQEMGEHDTICLACGYNTLTRQWGKTEKTLGVTGSRHFLHLLPALGSAAFTVFSIIALLMLYTVMPYWFMDIGWLTWLLDSEATRMWLTLIFLGIFWVAGMYCFHKFITKPKPDEIELD